MSFLRANIDRAIIVAQYDLRGFSHPVFGRQEFMSSAKFLDATTGNLVAMASREHQDSPPTDDNYASYLRSSFEDYRAMCMRLAAHCDLTEKEAIQLIVQEIVRQYRVMMEKVAAGKMQPSGYLKPLEVTNYWGKAVLSLAEAFEVKLDQPVGA